MRATRTQSTPFFPTMPDISATVPKYTVRGYGEEELLPWQTLSVGVDPGFLLRERRRAYEGLVTPDCRQACAGCGANRLLKEVGCDA